LRGVLHCVGERREPGRVPAAGVVEVAGRVFEGGHGRRVAVLLDRWPHLLHQGAQVSEPSFGIQIQPPAHSRQPCPQFADPVARGGTSAGDPFPRDRIGEPAGLAEPTDQSLLKVVIVPAGAAAWP
jgi:hypothetical protein